MLNGVTSISYIINLMALIGAENITVKDNHKIDWDYIESEYKLIQARKSKLSSNQRKAVVYMWERKCCEFNVK